MKTPIFLTLAEVLEMHAALIHEYGGEEGMRDFGLLQSALGQPELLLHFKEEDCDFFDLAAAYAFSICRNHPFIDGNKRTALASTLVFLEINGISLLDPESKLLSAMEKMAAGKLDRNSFARLLRGLPKK